MSEDQSWIAPSFPCYRVCLNRVDSTNIEARRRLSEMKSTSGFWVVEALQQTAGYGRKQSVWVSDHPKNLYATFCFESPAMFFPGLMTLWVGMEIHDVLRRFQPTDANVFVKWPNDLCLISAAGVNKCGGILMEHVDEWVLCGIGINVGASPSIQEIPSQGVLSASHLGAPLERVFAEVLRAMYSLALKVHSGDGWVEDASRAASRLEFQMKELSTVCQWFEVTPEGVSDIVIEGIERPTGALIVRSQEREKKVISDGSIYVRSVP